MHVACFSMTLCFKSVQAYWRGDLEAMSPIDKAKALIEARKKAEDEEHKKRMEAHDWPSLKKATVSAATSNGWQYVVGSNI